VRIRGGYTDVLHIDSHWQAAKARGVRLGRNGERLASANRAAALERANQIGDVLAELGRVRHVDPTDRGRTNSTRYCNAPWGPLASADGETCDGVMERVSL
jgi:hypothetical protein